VLAVLQITQKSSPVHRVSGATAATHCPVNTIALFEIRDKGNDGASQDEGGRPTGVGRLANTLNALARIQQGAVSPQTPVCSRRSPRDGTLAYPTVLFLCSRPGGPRHDHNARRRRK
jgi:hypothetical protein